MKINIRNILIAIVILIALSIGGYFLFKQKIQPTMEKHWVEKIDKLQKDHKDSIKKIDSLILEIAILQKQRSKITVVHDTKKIKELQAELDKFRAAPKPEKVKVYSDKEIEDFFNNLINK